MPDPRKPGFASRVVAANLLRESATADVLRVLDTAGVESLLLKGASVGRWLYNNQDPRAYADCDLLVNPGHLEAAEELLRGLRYRPEIDRHSMPAWWQEHAVAWFPEEDGIAVDLHGTIPDVGVNPDQLWQILAAHREEMVVGGFAAQTLTIPGRACLLALHAAHHGLGWGRFLDDLERGVVMADFATWKAAAELAASLEATPAFAAGLRLVEPGRALAARLHLPEDGAVDLRLKASTPPPIALGFDQLARAAGWRERVAILRTKFFPPVTFMRRWSPLARQGRLGLARAYVDRTIWLVRSTPAGFRAWRSARRSRGPQ